MPKRGQTKPWKMIYQWPDRRPGVVPYTTKDEAETAAHIQRDRTNPNTGEKDCAVRVEFRP